MLQRRVGLAKEYARRTLQVVALVGTLLVGIIALALIVSQTPLPDKKAPKNAQVLVYLGAYQQ